MSNLRKIVDDGVKVAAFSPSGKRIAYMTNAYTDTPHGHNLYLIDSDGSKSTRLIEETFRSGKYPSHDLSWSPDGEKIYFGHYIVVSDGTNMLNIGASLLAAVWSPDSKLLLLPRSEELYMINSDGTGLNLVARNVNYSSMPSWSPDGQRFVFSRRDGVYIANFDGSSQTRIAHADRPLVDWSSR